MCLEPQEPGSEQGRQVMQGERGRVHRHFREGPERKYFFSFSFLFKLQVIYIRLVSGIKPHD